MTKMLLCRTDKFFTFKLLFIVIIAFTWAGVISAHPHRVIFVNANNTSPLQNGTSWQTAFASLQDALDKAALLGGKNEIWVAQGIYIPTKTYSPNGIAGGACFLAGDCPLPNTIPGLRTFDLPNGVEIFGGFRGKEIEREERNPLAFKTILSGNNTSWHVVTLGNDVNQTGVRAKLDGLTITEGNAQGPVPPVFIFLAPFTYAHSDGGGIYSIFGSNITVNNVLFNDNIAGIGNGFGGYGGAFFSLNSDAHILSSHFINNRADFEGGGVQILNTFENTPHRALIETSLIEQNTAGLFGGGMTAEGAFNDFASTVELCEVTFRNNSAQVGGAFAVDSIKVTINDSKFFENRATVAGGALSTSNIVNTIAHAAVHPTPPQDFVPFTTAICNTKFWGNVAEGNLAAHDALFGGPALSGVDFPFGGGAIAVYVNGYLNVEDSNFKNNQSINSNGGAILNGRSAGQNMLGSGADGFIVNTRIINSIFEGNSALASGPLPSEANGGAIASLPSTFFPELPITRESTFLKAVCSIFDENTASNNGGAIYLNFSTAVLRRNDFFDNRAILGRSIYAIDSIINGSLRSIFIQP